jgi:hypothetical protein
MELRPVTIAPDSELVHEMFLVTLPSAAPLNALVMRFRGNYGHGSGGNGDAEYMTAVTRAAISFTNPFALIFDFAKLSYEWGDMMSQVLSLGDERWVNDAMPTAIVVSTLCEPSIRSLLIEEMSVQDLTLLHHSIEDALAYVDEKNKFGKPKGAA